MNHQAQRIAAFELLRLRRRGLTWQRAEELSGISRRTALVILPGAFFHDERGQLQVRGYDRYVRTLKVPTAMPGEFKWVRGRGSHEASLIAKWNNAIRAVGRGDFSLIDAFPDEVIIDGVHLTTSHAEVTRIAAAAAESDEPFEDIYSLAGYT